MPREEKMENPRSTKGEAHPGKSAGSGGVSGIEKVGGKTGIRFPIHNHPDKSVVRPGGK
jgi:hypothetical protein